MRAQSNVLEIGCVGFRRVKGESDGRVVGDVMWMRMQSNVLERMWKFSQGQG